MAKRSTKKEKKGKSWNQFTFSFRIWLRDWTLAISTVLTILCIFMIVFGGLALLLDYHRDWLVDAGPIYDWANFLHGNNHEKNHYDLCVFPLGILVILFAGWYMSADIVKRARFSKLMMTESKSEFLDNMDEIEKLAWELSSKHEMMVVEKKGELGIDLKKRR
jgi:hypothetical protein